MRQIVVKELVQFGVRHDAGEAIEPTFLRNLSRRLDESVHRDARKRAAHANATHAYSGEVIQRIADRPMRRQLTDRHV